ncbi:M2 family metallopeptidase [Myxococcota bacterium]|nr:M2 family metallopeptidase [Myxococcota bacterium]
MKRGQLISLSFVLLCCTSPPASPPATTSDPAPAVFHWPVTVADAEAFVAEAEEQLATQWFETGRASWVAANFITQDTRGIAADSQAELVALNQQLAAESDAFANLELPEDVRRKLRILKASLSMAAPQDSELQRELSEITTEMEATYATGRHCRPDGECLDLTAMDRRMAESRDPNELLDLWVGWREVSPPMRGQYQRFVAIANLGAMDLGFTDLGELWRSDYDMEPDAFTAEVERLWKQVEPLYEALHCHVRARLAEHYGPDQVSLDEPIPAHLLGNMWSQTWGNVYELVGPAESDPGYDLTGILRDQGVDARGMVRFGEGFFSSLGFAPLPETFWQRSLFTQPRDRDVVCHASAWDIDGLDDLRIKMCIQITGEDFFTVHHELGHNYYQRAYNQQPPLFQGSAHDGFHEGVGDTIALSITPEYLVQVGLLDELPPSDADLGLLMKMALDKVAFLAFGLLVDQWRWQVFSGAIDPADYNASWWELRERYQGIQPPVARDESSFDPGAKFHIPANVPYTRYFLAYILQFQFQRALCEIAGYEGPLHRCSIYGSQVAGERLNDMLELGRSKPWPDALEALTGQREMDASALIEYFAPLSAWLEEQNTGRSCGW